MWITCCGAPATGSQFNETGHIASYSYRHLRELIRKFAAAVKPHDLQSGDSVAGSLDLPLCVQNEHFSRAAAITVNRTTSITIALVTASLRGSFTSTATDMGVKVSPLLSTWQSRSLTSTEGNSRPIPTNTAQVHIF